MSNARRPRGIPLSSPGVVMVGIKGVTPELHRRMRIAAAEEGLAYHALIEQLLDQRDARIRRARAQQASPLHRPPPEQLDPTAVAL